ncbi:hypothetical protein BG006_003446 [Podila minutissima]|uniref:Uncharacterized protein n=1 Tax=Podila minutissima TaxID=64525 RepID=A0A9P5VN95_9FUNG|nr:hypothetical protein BG006_003446 [Podila minutissima]
MSPVHFKSSKRKILSSTDSVLKTEIFQQVADADDDVDSFVKRQDIQSCLRLDTTPTSSDLSTITTSTPSPSSKPQGQDPLSSVAVQLILGLIGFVLIAALTLRCFCLRRHHRAMRRNPQVSHAHAVPTNEMTLAGRLRTYQAAADANRYIYSSEPRSIAHASIGSFIAPSYDNDVSPPPFMASSGKPPSYGETLAV